MTHSLIALILVLLLTLPTIVFAAQAAPPLMLAKVAQLDLDYSGYLISEKFDGVRGFWNGSAMLTRSGNEIELPAWFAEGFSEQAVEGELWLARGRFDELSALVRRNDVTDPLWQQVIFKAFDLPTHNGRFSERALVLTQWAEAGGRAHIQAVEHFKLNSKLQVEQFLNELVAQGGEGLMLNRENALYQSARTDALLKLKPSWDDEAKVIGYTEGKGKYLGMVGALIVQRSDGLKFKIGSGLSDAQRVEPPAIGSLVTYEYSGYTSNGVPRFARFLREYHAL